MVLALVTFGLILLVGIILYGILLWENAIGLKFTKWYFILLFIVAVVGAIIASITGKSLLD
jgi:uncharacterized membrane protein YiaA